MSGVFCSNFYITALFSRQLTTKEFADNKEPLLFALQPKLQIGHWRAIANHRELKLKLVQKKIL